MTTKSVSKKRVKDLFMRFDSGSGISIISSNECRTKDIIIKDNDSVKTFLTKVSSFNFYLVYRCFEWD
jgi:hypothetical protein